MVNTLDYNSYSASYMKEGTQWKNTAVDDNSIKAFNKFNGGISKGAWDIIEEDGNGGVNNIDWSKYISENKVDMAFLNSKNLYVYKSDNKYFLLSLNEVKEIKDGQNVPKQSIEINNGGVSTLVTAEPTFKITTGIASPTQEPQSFATDKNLIASFQVMLGIQTIKVNWSDADNDKKIDYDEVTLEDNGKQNKLSDKMTAEFFNSIDTNIEGDNKGLDSDEIVKATEMLNKGESLGYNRNQYFESKKLETNMTVPVVEKKETPQVASDKSGTEKVDVPKKEEPEKDSRFDITGSAAEGNYKVVLNSGSSCWIVSKKVLEDNRITATGSNIMFLSLWVADKNGIYDFTKLKIGQELILPKKDELQGTDGLFDNEGNVNKKYEDALKKLQNYIGDYGEGKRKNPSSVFDSMAKANGIIDACGPNGKTLNNVITEAEKATGESGNELNNNISKEKDATELKKQAADKTIYAKGNEGLYNGLLAKMYTKNDWSDPNVPSYAFSDFGKQIMNDIGSGSFDNDKEALSNYCKLVFDTELTRSGLSGDSWISVEEWENYIFQDNSGDKNKFGIRQNALTKILDPNNSTWMEEVIQKHLNSNPKSKDDFIKFVDKLDTIEALNNNSGLKDRLKKIKESITPSSENNGGTSGAPTQTQTQTQTGAISNQPSENAEADVYGT
ncbi:MAG: hypothetical protein DKM50_01585 [Candidatus Margulisiibacteriota bacterium]|nr:MAG: hypothetical protein DKM50_01585 [Candidatus Margulisiibacteriota bacterium]